MNEAAQAISAAGPTVSAGSRWAAVAAALSLLLLLFLLAALFTRHWNLRQFVEGFDGRASTSKFQWFLWIVAILFAYTALWVLRAEQGNFTALSMAPAGLLTILGLSTGTAVAAKGITSAYVQSGRVTKLGLAPTEARGGILQDDTGRPDLAKIQMMGFTIVTIGIFLATVIHQIVSRPGVTSLPEIDTFLVVLMGISQGGYLGKKLVTTNAPTLSSAVLRNLPVTRSWSLISLVIAALVIVVLVIGAIFGRQGLKHTTSAGQWGGLLAFALLCSLISFAVVEMGKRLLPVRQFVQERYLLQWWATRAAAAVVPAEESWTELVEALDLRSSGRSIFGLPIQLLAAQVSNAADVALTEPSQHPLLYFTLTRSAEDVRVLRNEYESPGAATASDPAPAPPPAGPEKTSEPGGDRELIAKTAEEWRESRLPNPDSKDFPLLKVSAGSDDSGSFQAAQRARTAIDSLQLAVGERWRRSVQATSVFFAALAGLLIQFARPSDSRWLYIMAAALIGGPLAWTIRDLAAAIERWRR
jgi:hypothetical protein